MDVPYRTVLIIGPPRSGTTLLGQILGGSPRVLSISEPHLARSIMPAWKFQRFYRRFIRENDLKPVHFPTRGTESRLVTALSELARRNSRAVLAIKETFRVGVEFSEWNNEALLTRLARRVPTVFLIRHPLDVAASTIKLCRPAIGLRGRLLRLRWPNIPLFQSESHVVEWAATNWAAYADWLSQLGEVPTQYEAVVAQPAALVPEICRHLGLEFQGGMLDRRPRRRPFGGIGDYDVLHKPVRPIDRSAIGRGRALSPDQRALVWQVCGERASRLGYEQS